MWTVLSTARRHLKHYVCHRVPRAMTKVRVRDASHSRTKVYAHAKGRLQPSGENRRQRTGVEALLQSWTRGVEALAQSARMRGRWPTLARATGTPRGPSEGQRPTNVRSGASTLFCSSGPSRLPVAVPSRKVQTVKSHGSRPHRVAPDIHVGGNWRDHGGSAVDGRARLCPERVRAGFGRCVESAHWRIGAPTSPSTTLFRTGASYGVSQLWHSERLQFVV